MSRRREADVQRDIVRFLRAVLPAGAIVHHSPNETGSGTRAGRQRQAILSGMGVCPGWSDLVVLAEGRVLFLEVKTPAGRLSPAQRAFRDVVREQGHGFAVVRSIDEARAALAEHGIRTRLVGLS
jgi:hypothetical protein